MKVEAEVRDAYSNRPSLDGEEVFTYDMPDEVVVVTVNGAIQSIFSGGHDNIYETIGMTKYDSEAEFLKHFSWQKNLEDFSALEEIEA